MKGLNMTARTILLGCGIAASALYVVATVIGALVWRGYSTVDQSVSELFALGAPSRALIVAAFLAYDVLMVAFAAGVWGSAGHQRVLRVMAGLIVLDQLRGAAGTLFTPIHLRGVAGTGVDIWHAILTAATVLLSLLIIGLGARAFGPRFRRYSIGTVLVMVVFGALAGLQGPRMAANLPTPGFGIEERINIFGELLWFAVLAGRLLGAQGVGGPRRLGRQVTTPQPMAR